MKPSLLFALSTALLLASDASAQSRKRTPAGDFGERLGREIEQFVDRMTREFSDDEDDFFDDDSLTKKKRSRVRTADLEGSPGAVTYNGHTTVTTGRSFDHDVVVKGGDLTVFGTVDGDVLVVGGNLYVKDGDIVTGNARVINGSIEKEEGGIIEGYEDKTNNVTAGYREPRRSFGRSGTTFDVPWMSETANLENFLFRYNRVEGLFLGIGTEKRFYWDGQRSWNSFGSVGYGFRTHRWRGNLGLARQFSLSDDETARLIELGVEGYDLTDSKDRWLIGQNENSTAAILIHEDFRDYFSRRGATVHTAYYTRQDYVNGEFKVAYLMDTYDSLSKRTDWALFGGEKVFRPNPAIQPGKMRSLVGSFGVSTITKTGFGQEGWNVHGTAEVAEKSFGSDFVFTQYIVDIRRYQPLGRYDNFNLRLRAGTGDGAVPMHRTFDLGGLSTVHGYRFKHDVDYNRLLLVNAEYIVNGNFLDDLELWPTWLFRNFNFLFMSDAGLVRGVLPSSGPTEGFSNISWNEFRHSFGFGFANRSGSFRIGLAWRTDIKAPAQLVLRLNRPF